MRVRHHHFRGAGALLAVLLLIALSGAALTAYYTAAARDRQLAEAHDAGRVFAGWVLATHRAAQENGPAFAVQLGLTGPFVLTPVELAVLGAAPLGLPELVVRDAAMTLGVIGDGTATGVPMAFGLLEGDVARVAAMREGALAVGLVLLAQPGEETAMAGHEPAIEAVLGRALPVAALYVTADRGVRYRERVLHRRPQPGRPDLNRMAAELAMETDGVRRDIANAGAIAADRASTVDGDIGGNVLTDASAAAAALQADTMEAREVDALALMISGDLAVGQAVTGGLSAANLSVSGRLEAGGLQTAGSVTAADLAVAVTAEVEGNTAVTGAITGEVLNAGANLVAESVAATGVFGPSADIVGELTVGTCGGC